MTFLSIESSAVHMMMRSSAWAGEFIACALFIRRISPDTNETSALFSEHIRNIKSSILICRSLDISHSVKLNGKASQSEFAMRIMHRMDSTQK